MKTILYTDASNTGGPIGGGVGGRPIGGCSISDGGVGGRPIGGCPGGSCPIGGPIYLLRETVTCRCREWLI